MLAVPLPLLSQELPSLFSSPGPTVTLPKASAGDLESVTVAPSAASCWESAPEATRTLDGQEAGSLWPSRLPDLRVSCGTPSSAPTLSSKHRSGLAMPWLTPPYLSLALRVRVLVLSLLGRILGGLAPACLTLTSGSRSGWSKPGSVPRRPFSPPSLTHAVPSAWTPFFLFATSPPLPISGGLVFQAWNAGPLPPGSLPAPLLHAQHHTWHSATQWCDGLDPPGGLEPLEGKLRAHRAHHCAPRRWHRAQ